MKKWLGSLLWLIGFFVLLFLYSHIALYIRHRVDANFRPAPWIWVDFLMFFLFGMYLIFPFLRWKFEFKPYLFVCIFLPLLIVAVYEPLGMSFASVMNHIVPRFLSRFFFKIGFGVEMLLSGATLLLSLFRRR